MRRLYLSLMLCLAGLPAGCGLFPGASAPDSAWAPAPRADLLAPGEEVRIAVAGEPELTGVFRIGADGIVRLALVGPVQAAGLTPDMLAARLSERLAAGYLKNPRVVVRAAGPTGEGARPLLAGAVQASPAAAIPPPPPLRGFLNTDVPR